MAEGVRECPPGILETIGSPEDPENRDTGAAGEARVLVTKRAGVVGVGDLAQGLRCHPRGCRKM